MFSLRFKIFKPYNLCSSKYGQFYGKHKMCVSGGKQFYFARDLLTFAKAKTLRMV